ncbi:hypothetical protein diail_555 [Diaporthe ilicicola]|nr:hypothetical protein diail_555 [Diaporthe ilicicola]
MAVGSVVSSPVSIPRDVNTPLKLGQQNCFERFNHKDVSAEHQEDNIFRACQIAGTIGPKDYGVSIKHPIFLGPTYRYNIHWIPGCVTTVPEQEIWGPIPGDTSVTCPSLLSNDFLACNNGGAGGWIDAGCLRYTFSIKELPQGWE